MTDWKCPSCYQESAKETVQIKIDGVWVDSTVKRCVLCEATFGGTIDDRLAYVRDTYNYKYFGDYELTPHQADAVGTMFGMANMVPKLLSIVQRFVALDGCAWNVDRHARDKDDLMADAKKIIDETTGPLAA